MRTRRRRLWLLAPWCAALAAVSGCNGVFYQPQPLEYLNPAKLELTYESFFEAPAPGVRLHFWKIDAVAPKLGTVLHFHGNAQNMTAHFLYVAWLAAYGFDVVTFDYRGYGASTGQPEREGLIEDARLALKVAQRGGGDLFVVAQSLGGAVAVPALALEPPPSLRALALDSTFSSYRSIAREKLGSNWVTWLLQWPASFLVTDDWSPIDSAAKITVPLVLMHDPGDPVVPFGQGQRLFAALGSKAKELWEIKGGAHTGALADDARQPGDFRDRLTAFFCGELSDTSKRAACDARRVAVTRAFASTAGPAPRQ